VPSRKAISSRGTKITYPIGGHQVGDLTGLRRVLGVHFDFPFPGADPAHRQQIRDGKERFPLFSFSVHRKNQLITALPLIADLKGQLFSERRMDEEARGASGFEHGTEAGVLRQEGALGLAARTNTNSGPERVGKVLLPSRNYRIVENTENTRCSAGCEAAGQPL
jgi:hypothetical protein